jgi:predicted nucleic acid-binding protein
LKVLFDTNVVLDVVLRRGPFYEVAAQAVARVERHELEGVLGATTLTTLYYLVAKASGKLKARATVQSLIEIFEIAPVDRDILARAASGAFADYEDAVLYEAGLAVGAEALVTRDPDGFRAGRLPVLSPQELL